MNAFLKAIGYFDPEDRTEFSAFSDRSVTEISAAIGKRCYLTWPGGGCDAGAIFTQKTLSALLSRMLEHSFYAWEDELGSGYFPIAGGIRVGVTGKFVKEAGKTRLAFPTGIVIRLPKEVKGCAAKLVAAMDKGGVLSGAIILSPPGLGKTTMLRDACRLLGQKRKVSIIDERGELAAVYGGQPQFDVGRRVQVCEGLSKAEACTIMIRSMSPEVLVMDEIGSKEDAEAIFEASKMGVSVLASAHAATLEDALDRPILRSAMSLGAFGLACVLGPGTGEILSFHAFSEGKWHLKLL